MLDDYQPSAAEQPEVVERLPPDSVAVPADPSADRELPPDDEQDESREIDLETMDWSGSRTDDDCAGVHAQRAPTDRRFAASTGKGDSCSGEAPVAGARRQLLLAQDHVQDRFDECVRASISEPDHIKASTGILLNMLARHTYRLGMALEDVCESHPDYLAAVAKHRRKFDLLLRMAHETEKYSKISGRGDKAGPNR
jgi:hypothetical protein